MNNLLKLTLFIFSIMFVLLSCKKDEQQTNKELINTWKLVSISNTTNNETTLLPEDINYLSLTFVDSTIIEARSVCNSGFGEYSINNSTISIDIFFTKMACTNGINYPDWETWFNSNLNKASRFEVSGKLLTIYSEGSYILNFIIQE